MEGNGCPKRKIYQNRSKRCSSYPEAVLKLGLLDSLDSLDSLDPMQIHSKPGDQSDLLTHKHLTFSQTNPSKCVKTETPPKSTSNLKMYIKTTLCKQCLFPNKHALSKGQGISVESVANSCSVVWGYSITLDPGKKSISQKQHLPFLVKAVIRRTEYLFPTLFHWCQFTSDRSTFPWIDGISTSVLCI